MNANFIRVVNSPNDRCKVCGAESLLFDVVDFHGNVDLDPNMPQRKTVFPVCGIPIYYWKCSSCGLVYTRAFDAFSPADFQEMVYNQSWRDYLLGDPRERAIQIANILAGLILPGIGISGLDYGGGEGYLAAALNGRGLRFASYDPFCASGSKPDHQFDLITCIEVFEHVCDVGVLINDLDILCAGHGAVFFSTALCEGLSRCQGWGYCVPRSGHITFFTQSSLKLVFAAIRLNYRYLGIAQGHICHLAWRGRPTFLPCIQ